MKDFKKDALLSLLCGALTAAFAFLVIKNPYVTEFAGLAKYASYLIVLPVIFFIGALVGKFLEKFMPVLYQIVKFGEVGVLNTFVDMGVLNLLIAVTGITSGAQIGLLNTVSFLLAVTNSYFWNKVWTFKTNNQAQSKTFAQFVLVSIVGWGINTGIVILGTSVIAPALGLSAGAWANVIKLLATFVSMVWNFIGYKFFVFKNK
jgi:putative flippase GtrA